MNPRIRASAGPLGGGGEDGEGESGADTSLKGFTRLSLLGFNKGNPSTRRGEEACIRRCSSSRTMGAWVRVHCTVFFHVVLLRIGPLSSDAFNLKISLSTCFVKRRSTVWIASPMLQCSMLHLQDCVLVSYQDYSDRTHHHHTRLALG